MAQVDGDRLNALLGKMLGDLGGAYSVPTVRIGFRLGLFETLHREGAASAGELAQRTGLSERYLREWALAQAANGYLAYEESSDRFSLTPEQAMFFVVKESPFYLEGAFDLVAAMIEGEAKVEAAFRNGGGVAWGDSAGCLFCAVGAFFRPSYVNNIVQSWLPALDGVLPRLQAGIHVADVGCGVGFSTLLMAKAFPNSRFTGYDFHAPSIEQANVHARSHGLAERVRFETAAAKALPDEGFELVTMFDCLHDMGDPRGAAAHIRSRLRPGGTWMIVEPIASDQPGRNVASPVGRLYYNASTMICVPTSLSQEVGEALGAQAGEARLRDCLNGAGFAHVRRATEGPFNMVLEARP
ncbi:methyltransferase domain-containing protein [Pseudoroseomonas globiformis]|uniref:Methyltransferase domain-containing protein n=1 Tax=Teichococcus globiformis TaxID=2307229 RepID=A0ABV7G8D7_9PROT